MNLQEPINISVVKQLDGYNFSLSLSTIEKVKKMFPQATPISSVFVNYDTYNDFGNYIGKIEKYISSLLLGVDERIINSRKPKIRFIDPVSSKTLFIKS